MWMRRTTLVALVVLTAAGRLDADTPAGADNKPFFFKDGDTIIIMGDSITEQHLYSNYVEMWTVSRFPTWKLTFRNVGIGGDTAGGGNNRFKRDVLPYKATAMTVDFGMNDGAYKPHDEPRFQGYLKNLQGIADQAKMAIVRVAWITPQPTERREPGTQLAGYNETLEKLSAGVQQIAQKNDGLFVDQFHPYLAVMDKARAMDPKAVIMGGDAVHPLAPGQTVMAAAILKGLHFPRLVSAAVIDVGRGPDSKVLGARNCKIDNIAFLDGTLKFTRHDQALPFFPEDARSILKWTPILEDLNEYGLQVKGLEPGQYDVRLGGKKVAAYSAEDLAKGVNLAGPALKVGPVADQVKTVWKAVTDKNRYFHDRVFRGVVLANAQIPDWIDLKLNAKEIETRRQAAYSQRMEQMTLLDEAVRQALVMRPHQVEIVRVAQ